MNFIRSGEISGFQYCYKRESHKYHVHHRRGRAYLCGCLPDIKLANRYIRVGVFRENYWFKRKSPKRATRQIEDARINRLINFSSRIKGDL